MPLFVFEGKGFLNTTKLFIMYCVLCTFSPFFLIQHYGDFKIFLLFILICRAHYFYFFPILPTTSNVHVLSLVTTNLFVPYVLLHNVFV